MKRIAALVFALTVFPAFAVGQFTLVSGTITDPNGIPYAFGQISISLVVPGGTSPTLNGSSFGGATPPFTLDSTGSFTIRLPDNNQISPAGTQWKFAVTHSYPPPWGLGPVQFTSTITITGTTQDIGSILTAAAPALTRFGSPRTLDQIRFADQFASVQAAINNLPAAGGVVYLVCGSSSVGPTTIPGGVSLIALCPSTIGGAGTFTTPLYNTTLTYSANLKIGESGGVGIQGVELHGVTLTFSGTSSLTISSVTNSVFDMTVTCVTAAVCVNVTSTLVGGATYWNRFQTLQVITGGATGLQLTSPTNTFVTNNHFWTLVLVLTGTSHTAALSFTQNCDSNKFEMVKIYYTNTGAVASTYGAIFNNSGTPAVNSDSDYEKILWLDITSNASSLTGTALQINNSTGNSVAIGLLSGFSSKIAFTGNPNFTLDDAGGNVLNFGSGLAATGFHVFPTSGAQANTTKIISGNPSAGTTMTLPTTSDTFVGRATTDTLTNKTLSTPLNGQATVDQTVPLIRAGVHLTGQTASIGTTTLLAGATAGTYRVCFAARTSTAGNGTTATVSVTWNPGPGNMTFTSSTFSLAAIDITGQVNSCQLFAEGSGQAVSYAVTVGAIGTSAYALDIELERLQ